MSSTSSSPWLTGQIFDGHFEVGRLIARGGMAEVYHGVDLWSNNPVAIKVLYPQLSADPSQQQKFFREERSLRQINHQHVVGVLGSGSQKIHGYQLMFIVLDYVHGCTLQQLLASRPVLSVQETLDIMLPVVEGLSEVHAHRLIHRDIKPSNILLSATEQTVKLTDFGLTRRTDQSWTGELMGTPAYVAPEIVTPQGKVGPGVDIFALGIMMFRMLTGRLPFPGMGDDQQVIYHNVNTEIPSIARYAPGVSPDLVGLIKWCTRKQASARPADATELFELLKEVAGSLTTVELLYRADISEPPANSLWEAVEAIAEQTEATKVLDKSSLTALAGKPYPAGVDQRELYEAEVYEPVEVSGVGPEPEPRKSASRPQSASPDETILDTPLEDFSKPKFEPISASYSPKQAGRQQQEVFYDEGWAEPAPTASKALPQKAAPQKSQDPRRPDRPWIQPPSLITVLLILALVLLGFVAAGFLGWELAHAVLSSTWFSSWSDIFPSN